MKTIVLLLLSALIVANSTAQNVLDKVNQKIKDKSNQRADSKVDRTIDKGLDKTEQAIDSLFTKKQKKTKKEAGAPAAQQSGETGNGNGTVTQDNNKPAGTTTATQTKPAVTANSFSDFTPGATVIFFDDFSQDALSDFPAKWNSNGSGRVTTLNGMEGRWLELKMNTAITPELPKALPENSTIEFDLFLDAQNGQSTPFIQFGLTQVKNILKEDMFYKSRFFMNIHRYAEHDGKTIEYGLANDVLGSKGDFDIEPYANKILHVSMAINKSRIRVYLDKTKVVDLPRALTPEMRNNFFINSNMVIPAPELNLYVSNVRIASAETDARSLVVKQLLEEGRAVTNDILFDVNKDVIKPESYDIVNQFGEALKVNAGLKIKITGHTDNDGTGPANVDLSKRRAAAVKKYIVVNYGIADARIQTDGKGAAFPVADNNNAAGKAKNRRVEFEKL